MDKGSPVQDDDGQVRLDNKVVARLPLFFAPLRLTLLIYSLDLADYSTSFSLFLLFLSYIYIYIYILSFSSFSLFLG